MTSKFAFPTALVGAEAGLTVRQHFTLIIAAALLARPRETTYPHTTLVAETTNYVDALLRSVEQIEAEEARVEAEYRKEQQS